MVERRPPHFLCRNYEFLYRYLFVLTCLFPSIHTSILHSSAVQLLHRCIRYLKLASALTCCRLPVLFTTCMIPYIFACLRDCFLHLLLFSFCQFTSTFSFHDSLLSPISWKVSFFFFHSCFRTFSYMLLPSLLVTFSPAWIMCSVWVWNFVSHSLGRTHSEDEIWGYHSNEFVDGGLLCCNAVWTHRYISTFRRDTLPSFVSPENGGSMSHRNVDIYLQTLSKSGVGNLRP
jgi:hypothetical protein